MNGTKSGVELIAEERERQIKVEGFTPEHDNGGHWPSTLAKAAACYCCAHTEQVTDLWPWDAEDFKPGSELKDLVRAGALIAAAIDLLQRKQEGRIKRK